jgi:hypothetical protein
MQDQGGPRQCYYALLGFDTWGPSIPEADIKKVWDVVASCDVGHSNGMHSAKNQRILGVHQLGILQAGAGVASRQESTPSATSH